jgi:hypothetical protein
MEFGEAVVGLVLEVGVGRVAEVKQAFGGGEAGIADETEAPEQKEMGNKVSRKKHRREERRSL